MRIQEIILEARKSKPTLIENFSKIHKFLKNLVEVLFQNLELMTKMATYKLSLSDFQGEVEMYKRYKESIDRAREMDRWSEYMRSIESQQAVDKNKISDFDADMTESKSTKK